MNIESLLKQLFLNARQTVPSDRVPYAFEQRVMARIRELRPPDRLTIWTVGLWRAALSSVAVALVLVGANAFAPYEVMDGSAVDQLEAAVVASADPFAEPR